MLDKTGAMDGFIVQLNGLLSACSGASIDEAKQEKLKIRLLARFTGVLPVFTNSLFRLFDADNSGGISKAEFVAVFSIHDPQHAIPAIFRVLDTNNNGAVDSVELASFVSDVIVALVSLVEALIDEFEPVLEVPVKKFVVDLFTSFTGGSGTLNIQSCVTSCTTEIVSAMKGEGSGEVSQLATSINMIVSSLMMPVAQASMLVPPEITSSLTDFLRKFDEKAGSAGALPKAEVVRMATDAFLSSLPHFVDAKKLIKPFTRAVAAGIPGIEIDSSDLEDVVSAATGIKSYY